jgi:hypothetical protein
MKETIIEYLDSNTEELEWLCQSHFLPEENDAADDMIHGQVKEADKELLEDMMGWI